MVWFYSGYRPEGRLLVSQLQSGRERSSHLRSLFVPSSPLTGWTRPPPPNIFSQAGPLTVSPKPDPDGYTSFSPPLSQEKLEVIKRKFTRKSRRVAETGGKNKKQPWHGNRMFTGPKFGPPVGRKSSTARAKLGRLRAPGRCPYDLEKCSLPLGQPQAFLQPRCFGSAMSSSQTLARRQPVPVLPYQRSSLAPMQAWPPWTEALSHPGLPIPSVRGSTVHRDQAARTTTNKKRPPTPVSQALQKPPPSPPYQSRGTAPMFFRARSTTEGWASIGAAPKLKSSFRGVKTVGIWLVLCGTEKQTQRQVGTV